MLLPPPPTEVAAVTPRWMIALALLATLCFVGPASAAQFVEILEGSFPSAAGGAWGDYDGDGYPDLFLADGDEGTAVPVPHGPLLYHNNHNLTFTEVGESLGLTDASYSQWGAAWADYDNNGLPDILVGDAYWPSLYAQSETGFLDLAGDAGFHIAHSSSYSQNWCDYNGDNHLDAFSSNIFGPGYLMLNNGDGTFTEMSVAAGMTGDAANDSAHGASWADFDNDGLPDLALARLAKPAKLYRNNGDGTFTDVSSQSGVDIAVDCQSPVWGDYDNDGWLDLYLTAGPYLDGNGGPHWLLHNNRDGTFTDARALVGMSGAHTVGGGAGWADYDNDGYLDLYVGNWGTNAFLYHNNAGVSFTNAVVGSGIDMLGSYQAGAACWGDLDLDGRLDLVQCTFATDLANNRTRLFWNIGGHGNWLRVRALTSEIGDATAAVPTRDAIGARVELNLDDDDSFPAGGHRTLTRLVDGGSGWLGQNEQIAQFGLGSAYLVAVRVLFPDGSVVIHRNVAANRQITIRDVPADRTRWRFTSPAPWSRPRARPLSRTTSPPTRATSPTCPTRSGPGSMSNTASRTAWSRGTRTATTTPKSSSPGIRWRCMWRGLSGCRPCRAGMSLHPRRPSLGRPALSAAEGSFLLPLSAEARPT